MTVALLNHLWQSTLFGCGAGLLTLMFRRNGAHTRYWLWFAASTKFLVPFSLLMILGGRLAPQGGAPALALPVTDLAERVAAPFANAPPVLSARASMGLDVSSILLVLWTAGTVTLSVYWWVRWMRINAVLRLAQPLPLVAPIPVKSSLSLLEPGLVGIWRPVLLLPDRLMARLSADETRAILAHELCHHRRRDNLLSGIHMLVEALFWFHPLTWWLGARLLEERERACDESVLASGNDAQVYAESILKVCRLGLQPALDCTAGVSGADLKKRMEVIMNSPATVRLNAVKKLLLSVTAAAAVAIPIVFGLLMAPGSSAQTLPVTAVPTPTQIAQQRFEQARPRTAVPFNPQHFDKYVGYYQFSPTVFFHVFHDADHYLTQLTGQPSVEVYPESESMFFAQIVPAQISFVADSQGQVTQLVLHQNGYETPAKKVDASVAQAAETDLQRRINAKIPSPGTEASLRRYIDALEIGAPNYDEMSPGLAALVRQQLPTISKVIQRVGKFQSLAFKGVGQDGSDVYEATFANGQLEWRIAPLSAEGKVERRGFRELP